LKEEPDFKVKVQIPQNSRYFDSRDSRTSSWQRN